MAKLQRQQDFFLLLVLLKRLFTHLFMFQCMKAYVEFEISQGAYEISCPDAMCEAQGVVTLSEIENLVNSDTMEKHKRYRLNKGNSLLIISVSFDNNCT